jgi:hypothetical protein
LAEDTDGVWLREPQGFVIWRKRSSGDEEEEEEGMCGHDGERRWSV